MSDVACDIHDSPRQAQGSCGTRFLLSFHLASGSESSHALSESRDSDFELKPCLGSLFCP